MARFFTDFSEYTTGVQPSDWTERWNTTYGSSATTADAAMLGGKKLRQLIGTNGYYVASWDDLDSEDDVEVLVRIIPRTDVDHVCRVFLRGSGTTSTRTGYWAYFHVNSGTVGIHKYVSGSSSSVSSFAGGPFSVDTAYMMRFRANGTALKLKVWAAASSEPTSWDIDTTDASIATGDWNGVGAYTTSTQDIDWIAYTTNGETAALPVLPPSGSLTFTGSTPAIGIAPASGALTLSAGTPVPGVGIPVAPASGSLTFTGQTPVPVVAIGAFPGAGQLQFTGSIPQMIRNDLVISLPAITLALGATGNYATLDITLPAIEFAGTLNNKSQLDVELPVPELLLTSGGALALTLPVPELLFSGLVGATCALDIDIPMFTFAAQTGAALPVSLPNPELLFSATVGTTADLVLSLPNPEVLFSADVQNLAQLDIILPSIQLQLSSEQQNICNLVLEVPPLQTLFTVSNGLVATLDLEVPSLELLFSSYEDITAQLVVSLPIPELYLESSRCTRFATTNQAQIDNVTLKFTRPS